MIVGGRGSHGPFLFVPGEQSRVNASIRQTGPLPAANL